MPTESESPHASDPAQSSATGARDQGSIPEASSDERTGAGGEPTSYLDFPDTVEVMRGLLEAGHHLSPGSKGGSHTEVFALDPVRLAGVLEQWIRLSGRDPAQRSEEIRSFSREIADRFIFKIGNIEYFVMRLGKSEEAVMRRATVSEAFGPVGYSLHPSFDKTVQDATEASREIPYFASGPPADQFAYFLPDALRQFVHGEIDRLPPGDEDGLFLVYDVDARRELSVFEILDEDPYFTKQIGDFQQLREFQRRVRSDPIDRATEERLRNFFSAPITVGVRDTIRWFMGTRHPEVDWPEARAIIEDCFGKHGEENFLLPETNLYARSARLSASFIEQTERSNRDVVEAFFRGVRGGLPLRESRKIGNHLLRDVCEQVLRHHHDYPVFRIEPTTGWLNMSSAKLLGRVSMALATHLSGAVFPNRKNIDVEAALYRRGLLEILQEQLAEKELDGLLEALRERLFAYLVRGGVELEDGQTVSYEQIPTTFYSMQQRADFMPAGERIIHRTSLEDLAKPELRFLLREFPELAEKLVVFFVLILRFYLDTDFIPDLRPDEAGVNILVLGIWGAMTENVLVFVTEDERGDTHVRIRFVDNKDHFKAYRREVDRDQPLGLAKHALRIVGPVVEPAMLRAVGEFVQAVANNRKGFRRRKLDVADAVEKLLEIFGEVVRRSMDETQAHVKAMVEDSLDDTTRAVSQVVRRALRKPGAPHPHVPPAHQYAASLEPRGPRGRNGRNGKGSRGRGGGHGRPGSDGRTGI
jgi:hypothetical protein